jgi:hypothetical protein
MTGTDKKITWTNNEDVGSLTISGTITLNEIDGNDSYLQWNGAFTVDASKTLSSTTAERLICNSSSDTIVINNAATGLSGLYALELYHASGTISISAMTIPKLLLGDGGTTQATGDHTITTELEVGSGCTYNANGNTIACKYVDVNGGTLNLSNSTLNFSVTSDADAFDMNDASTLTAGPTTTITGYSSTSKTSALLPSAGGFEVVGDIKWLKVYSGGDLTVIGRVIDCELQDSTANIRQFHHTIDTQQLLDADETGDKDLKLTRPSLDNALQLQTGG